MHKSIATIDSPEFINLQPLDINPLMSKCEIKVLYLGENRNGSSISKEVATKMSKTLRGAPIVGYYKKDKEDFMEHSERVTIEDGEIKFECLTIPYGFVDPSSPVWFKNFYDYDEFGGSVERTYMMVNGFLWTGQFEECKCAVEEGRPHSMELDSKTLNGEWSYNINKEMDFFIINDATFSKLCILGDDVEPCFEGSSVTSPQVSSSFSLNDDFKQTLYSMMQDLKFALEGGKTMENKNFSNEQDKKDETTFVETQNNIEDNSVSVEFACSDDDKKKEFAASKDEEKKEEKSEEEDKDKKENFAKKDDEEEAKEDKSESDEKKEEEASEDDEEDKKNKFAKEEDEKEEASEEKDSKEEDDSKKEDKEDKKNFALLEQELSDLKVAYAALQKEHTAILNAYNEIQNEKKDELINSFYMLSEEDKKDVIENKTKYSLEEIKSKLAVICFDKKISFADDSNIQNKGVVTTFNFIDSDNSMPDWLKAVEKNREKR